MYLTIDIDECASNNGGCNQTCNNTDGSFTCSCDSGYTLDSDRLGCSGISNWYTHSIQFLSDINECADDNGCEHNCNNTLGSYVCVCDEGYGLNDDNHTCRGRHAVANMMIL